MYRLPKYLIDLTFHITTTQPKLRNFTITSKQYFYKNDKLYFLRPNIFKSLYNLLDKSTKLLIVLSQYTTIHGGFAGRSRTVSTFVNILLKNILDHINVVICISIS